MLEQTRTRITVAEFYQLEETNQIIELIDGEIVMSPAPELPHQDATGNIYTMFKSFTQTLGGKVYFAPVDVYFDDSNNAQPDVLWIAPEGRCVAEGTKRLRGAPDLIVEVLSPSTERNDRGKKFLLYQKYGVREYWLVNPAAQFIEVYVLLDGKFSQQGVYAPDETFTSPVLGGQLIPVSAIFA